MSGPRSAAGGPPPLWPGGLAEVRAELERRGLRLTKRYGQNFMVDPNLARAVVRAAGAGEGEVVLEVGAGAGHLTSCLLEAGARVVAVEIDGGLCRMLRERLGGNRGLRLVEGSALARGDVLAAQVTEALREETSAAGRDAFRVAGNLPYNIAATFLISLASSSAPSGPGWSGGAVTLQREVAERLAASPGTRAYGASSVLWQLRAEGRIDRVIPREVFWPRPKVDSALFVIEPRPDIEPRRDTEPRRDSEPRRDTEPRRDSDRCGAVVGRTAAFARFVKALFSARRKVLRTAVAKAVPSLAKHEADSALAAAGIDPKARAEDVAPEGLLGLWEGVRSLDG